LSATPLRVGIIGAGQAGERHAVGFSSIPETRVVGVADIVQGRAAELAQRFDATAYTDWRAMLDDGLEILVVSLPHSLHVAPAEAAAERGVHVMMEKPIATTLADGRRIVEVCAAQGVKLSVSFVHRFREESQLLHRWIREGRLGAPRLARETMNIERTPHVPGWVMDKTLGGGGVLMYSAIHGVDRLRWLLNSEVVQVTAQTVKFQPETEVEDGVAALLIFANGASATLMTTAPTYPAQPTIWESEIYGVTGMARLRTRQWALFNSAAEQIHQETESVSERLGPHYNFVRQAQAFAQAILEEREPPVTGQDGLAALAVALAIYRSAEIGEPVRLGGPGPSNKAASGPKGPG
jgi:predicted dehydrogenase